MLPSNDPEFHDPTLKDAVRRCWGCDCAPSELHGKVSHLLGGSAMHQPASSRRWVIWPMAVAACLVVAVGVFHQFKDQPVTKAVATALPVSLETDLIRTHDHCITDADHQHLPVPRDDDVAIASALRDRLKQPVVVFHPTEAGWNFRGASICPVGTTPSGHLVFARGDDTLSIFNLPQSVLPNVAEGSSYSGDFDGHQIVGFVKDGAVFCLVGKGSGDDVSLDTLKKMESQMLPAVAVTDLPNPSPIFLTELLHPVEP